MTVNNVSLEAVAVAKSGFPATGMPEIAFVGRSNVGKSSLINTMVNRKALARTSQSPGKTRTINFYNVESKLYFVDLPGYGYSKAGKAESAKWGKMIEGYLLGRKELRAIALLLDIRHAPSENDIMMFNFMRHYGYDMLIAATKADKVTKNRLPGHVSEIRKTLLLPPEAGIVPFSSETKQGRDELWGIIENKLFLDV